MYQLATKYCRSDIDEARVISFLRVQTDKQDFGILKWKHQTCLHAKNSARSSKLGVSCRIIQIWVNIEKYPSSRDNEVYIYRLQTSDI